MNIGQRCDGIGTRRTSANLHSAQLQMGIAWFSICFARSNRQMQAASSRSLEGLDWTSHRGWPSRLGPRGVRVGVECRSSFLFLHFLRKCLIIIVESPELVYAMAVLSVRREEKAQRGDLHLRCPFLPPRFLSRVFVVCFCWLGRGSNQ
jgi:hypothetical protein